MPPDTATTPARSNGNAVKVRLLTLESLDGRTKAARLARDLIDTLEDDLGGADRLSVAERQIIQRAAVLGAMLESQEAAWIAGEPIELTVYLPAANAQRRLLETVGLQRRAKEITPDLRSYMQAGK